MSGHLRFFSQEEYSRVLNEHGGYRLSNSQCIGILMEHGASPNQAKNGAYNYLHHRNHLLIQQKGWQGLYDQILDEYDGVNKTNMECVRHLEEQEYSHGQAKNAVYNYRLRKGLVKYR